MAKKYQVHGKFEGSSVQPDWDQTDKNANDFIKNKPDESDALMLVVDMGLVQPIMNENGSLYTDENGNVYSL